MNERIKQLAEQANADELSYAYYRGEKRPENAVTLHSVDLEKFAELIVRECARLCEHESNDDEYDQYDMGQSVKAESIKTAIKKHFGVE